MATHFEIYAAMCVFGLSDQLGMLSVGGENTLKTTVVKDPSAQDFWARLSQAVCEYPPTGYRVMREPLVREFVSKDNWPHELVEQMNRLALELQIPGWAVPSMQVSSPIMFRISPGMWSTLPSSCDSMLAMLDDLPLLDEFQIVTSVASALADDLTQRKQSAERVVSIRNSNDWVEHLSCGAELRKFAGSPQQDWNDEFLIPSWTTLKKPIDIFISISAYLGFAYEILHLPSGQKTMLAGWHPASIVRVVG